MGPPSLLSLQLQGVGEHLTENQTKLEVSSGDITKDDGLILSPFELGGDGLHRWANARRRKSTKAPGKILSPLEPGSNFAKRTSTNSLPHSQDIIFQCPECHLEVKSLVEHMPSKHSCFLKIARFEESKQARVFTSK